MALRDTTIRDFGGGWNVADSDVNLESRYQPISDNVRRGIDGSMSVRSGYGLFSNLHLGTEVPFSGDYSCEVAINQAYIEITMTAHGRVTGDHCTITAFSGGALGSIDPSDALGTHGILVIDADTFRIPTRFASSSLDTSTRTITGYFDDHLLGGNIIHMHYFNRRLVLFDDIGEIATLDGVGAAVRIWDYGQADTLTAGLIPTRECDVVSTTTFKSTLISCNGYDKDKPLQIFSDFHVTFLIDKAAGGSAQFVPKADYVVGMHGYVIFIRTEPVSTNVSGDSYLSFSAKGTDGVFVGNPSPLDATQVDLSIITDTVEPLLLGAGALRDKLFVGFYDRGMIGTLSIYGGTSGAVHQPDFEDTIAEHGVIAHRTIVPLGNDIFMADYAGVPSVSISQQSGVFVPSRLSDLISPEMTRHLSSLAEDTLRKRAFAVYNKTEREYMLFVPKYDETSRSLPNSPFYFNDELRALNLAYVTHPNHNLIDNSYVTFSGAEAIGSVTADMINGVRRVVAVASKDAYVVEFGGPLIEDSITNGGGPDVSIIPVNDETIGYIYEYNKELKIRRWTRYRDLNFDCGAVSQRGIIYFAKGGRVYQFGTKDVPISADHLNDYDDNVWANNHAYTVGWRVKDQSDLIVYQCVEAHTSSLAGTFADERALWLDRWVPYKGEPIRWAAETPWSDFKARGQEKHLVYVAFDTDGDAQFDVSVFTNNIRINPDTYILSPPRTMQMTSRDAGGWGIEDVPSWGTGRRSKEDRVWPFDVRGKLIRFRYSGATITPFRLVSHTLYYFIGSVRR